jgi:hypothetical protein
VHGHTLHKHERIRHAFDLQKKNLSEDAGEVRRVASPELQVALDRIAGLEAEFSELISSSSQSWADELLILVERRTV